ncbi:MAG: ATP-binding protein [Nitrospinales bacterium]
MDLHFETSKVLIVDDEKINVDLLYRALTQAGYTNLYTTLDPREVCGLYQSIQPDLILLDIRMPYMDGFEVMKQLDAIKGVSYLPILVLTAESDDETRLSALGSGGKDFMGKPLNISELLLRVRNLLEIKLLHDQVKNQNIMLEEAVFERTKQLHAINQELISFNFIASHDLQEPLRKIITFNDRLQLELDGNLSEKGEYYIDRMRLSAMRLQALVDDLLKFSRLESGGSDFEQLDVGNVLNEVVDDLEIQIEKTNAVIKIGSMPIINADRSQLRQLFQNLITNSLKYCQADVSPIISIESFNVEKGFLEIIIEDNGIGIDEKYSELIFQPFKRLHQKDQYEGTGMGLFICRKIISRHGGKISLNSELGKGAKFKIILPRRQKG